MNRKLHIVVVDDHSFFRKGVVMTINRFKYAEVVGEACNGEELLKLLQKITPDIILMDIKMPVMDGIEATRKVLKINPNLKIIALSMFGDEEYLESMIDAGIQGFLLKNADSDDLDRALKAIAKNKQYFSEEFLPYFTNKYLKKNTTITKSTLTKRELEILKLVAKGKTNQEIADKLFISLRTVTSHRANLNSKTGSKNTVNLLSYAIRHKLINM